MPFLVPAPVGHRGVRRRGKGGKHRTHEEVTRSQAIAPLLAETTPKGPPHLFIWGKDKNFCAAYEPSDFFRKVDEAGDQIRLVRARCYFEHGEVRKFTLIMAVNYKQRIHDHVMYNAVVRLGKLWQAGRAAPSQERLQSLLEKANIGGVS